jgi:hypothetical protein
MSVELPVTLVRSVTRRLVTSVAVVASPFTGSQQVQDWGGEFWQYEIEFAVHRGRNGKLMSAFLASLGGPRGTFLFRDPTIEQTGLASPTVNGAGQTGNTLVTAGWPNNATVLQAGDFIQIGSGAMARLHQLTADAVSGPTGVATLSIVPRLRYAPANGSAVTVNSPAVLLRASAPVPVTITRPDRFSFTMSAVEAL